MEFLEQDVEKLYGEAKEKAHAEGAYAHEAWRTVIDDLLEGHEEFGEIEEDAEQELKDLLYARFEDFSDEIPQK